MSIPVEEDEGLDRSVLRLFQTSRYEVSLQ